MSNSVDKSKLYRYTPHRHSTTVSFENLLPSFSELVSLYVHQSVCESLSQQVSPGEGDSQWELNQSPINYVNWLIVRSVHLVAESIKHVSMFIN